MENAHRQLGLGKIHGFQREAPRAAMGELGTITKSKHVPLETKAEIIHSLLFLITMYGLENWTVKKADRKNTDSLEIWNWREFYRYPG